MCIQPKRTGLDKICKKDTQETFYKDKLKNLKNPLQLCYSQHFVEGILV